MSVFYTWVRVALLIISYFAYLCMSPNGRFVGGSSKDSAQK